MSNAPPHAPPRRRTWAWLLALMALGSAGSGWLYHRRSSKPPPHYETVMVERGELTGKITATGTLSALVTVQVGTQVSGRVSELRVDFNSPVKKGELIAKIDPELFQAAVEQAKANDVAAEGNLAKARAAALDARRQLDRDRALMDRKLIAQADLDTADANGAESRASVDAALGAVQQNRAQLHQAEINLQYTSIVSPIDGVVISRNVDVGQTVAASLQAPVLFTIAEDLRKMQVDTSVAEADVGKLADGMIATFTVDAYPNERFQGTIRQIRNAPQTVQNVVTYDAVIDVANPDLKLRPGMTANATVVFARRAGVLRAPNAALRFRPPASFLTNEKGGGHASGPTMGLASTTHPQSPELAPDQRRVWVLQGGVTPTARVVRIGLTDGAFTEVLDGELHQGDELITEAPDEKGPAGSPMPFRRMF